jgi:DNA primase
VARIPDHIIDQVRDAHDVVEVVGRTVPLKKAGSGYKGLCPFHDEKTPSFTVNPGRQTFKCFGCGKGGNVFTFLTETQGLNFPEAVRQLAEERGIHVPASRPADPEVDSRIDRIRKALAFAHRFFVGALASPEGDEARAYLADRGYDAAAIEQFGLGYAPAAWDRLLAAAAKAGVPADALDEAGLVVPKADGAQSRGRAFYDRFRHRIIFPIADGRGRLATFAGRTLDPEENAKYLNGPETTVFKKANVLYALHRAREAIRRKGEALLMEGYTDVLMCHLNGFEHAVAGMGTAFTERQAGLLRRLVDRVVLLYDGDAAGQIAAERALDVLLEQGLEVRIALLPPDRDVDEILLEEGPPALEKILGEARELFEFKLGLLAERHDLGTPRGRARASEELLASVARVRSPLERDQLLRFIAERLGGGPDTEQVLRAEFARILGASAPARSRSVPPVPEPPPEPAEADEPPRPLTMAERIRQQDQERKEITLLAGAVFLPDIRDSVFRAIGPEEFADPDRARLYNALLDLWGQGREIDHRGVMALFQSDAAVSALLAGLPEDATLPDRVLSCVEYTEKQRGHEQRVREQDRRWRLGGAGAPDEVAAAAALDPDGSFYGDESTPGTEAS